MFEGCIPESAIPQPQPAETRRSYRVACLLPVWYRVVPTAEWPQAVKLGRYYPEAVLALPWVFYGPSTVGALPPALRGDVLNLSADGVLLRAKNHLDEGVGLELALQLPDLPQPLGPILARIVWICEDKPCLGGLEFINLPELYREFLIGFSLRHQRQLRRQVIFG